MNKRTPTIALAAVLIPSVCFAWGRDGHRITGFIGDVDAADLANLLGSWGPCEGCPADFDGDNDVNAADLAQLLGAWGMCP